MGINNRDVLLDLFSVYLNWNLFYKKKKKKEKKTQKHSNFFDVNYHGNMRRLEAYLGH